MKGPWINGRVKSRIFRKSSLNFTFGQGSCLISDFARLKPNKTVLLEISSRFNIGIFNNNFVVCVAELLDPVMSSFCSMSWLADCFIPRKIVKRISVFYPVCLRKYWKRLDKHLWRGLFCENCAITHHSLHKVNQPLKFWENCLLNYEKIKNLRKIWRKTCFKLYQMNYINCRNKEHMR